MCARCQIGGRCFGHLRRANDLERKCGVTRLAGRSDIWLAPAAGGRLSAALSEGDELHESSAADDRRFFSATCPGCVDALLADLETRKRLGSIYRVGFALVDEKDVEFEEYAAKVRVSADAEVWRVDEVREARRFLGRSRTHERPHDRRGFMDGSGRGAR